MIGIVRSGVNQATSNMSGRRLAYLNELTGYDLVPGTLNVSLTDEVPVDLFLSAGEASVPSAFPMFDEKSSTGCFAWVTVNGLPAVMIWDVEQREVKEIMSPHHFRTELGLEDGDEVDIQHTGPQ